MLHCRYFLHSLLWCPGLGVLGIKMGFPIHERISRIDRDTSLVITYVSRDRMSNISIIKMLSMYEHKEQVSMKILTFIANVLIDERLLIGQINAYYVNIICYFMTHWLNVMYMSLTTYKYQEKNWKLLLGQLFQ